MLTAEQFTEAFGVYNLPLRNFLRRQGASADQARDAAQETWARAWQFRDQWRGGNLKAWLFVIALNAHNHSFRRQLWSLEEVRREPSYSETFDRKIEAHQVLARCKPQYAAVLRRRYLDGEPSMGRLLRVRVLRAKAQARRAARMVSDRT